MTLHFIGNSAEMSLRVFEQLSELMAESWLKALSRWEQVNGREARVALPADEASRSEFASIVQLSEVELRSVPKSVEAEAVFQR